MGAGRLPQRHIERHPVLFAESSDPAVHSCRYNRLKRYKPWLQRRMATPRQNPDHWRSGGSDLLLSGVVRSRPGSPLKKSSQGYPRLPLRRCFYGALYILASF